MCITPKASPAPAHRKASTQSEGVSRLIQHLKSPHALLY